MQNFSLYVVELQGFLVLYHDKDNLKVKFFVKSFWGLSKNFFWKYFLSYTLYTPERWTVGKNPEVYVLLQQNQPQYKKG